MAESKIVLIKANNSSYEGKSGKTYWRYSLILEDGTEGECSGLTKEPIHEVGDMVEYTSKKTTYGLWLTINNLTRKDKRSAGKSTDSWNDPVLIRKTALAFGFSSAADAYEAIGRAPKSTADFIAQAKLFGEWLSMNVDRKDIIYQRREILKASIKLMGEQFTDTDKPYKDTLSGTIISIATEFWNSFE